MTMLCPSAARIVSARAMMVKIPTAPSTRTLRMNKQASGEQLRDGGAGTQPPVDELLDDLLQRVTGLPERR